MNLKKKGWLNKIIIASSAVLVMGAAPFAVQAKPTAKIWGMLGVVGSMNTATVSGDKSSYAIQNNISQVGVKGTLGSVNMTKFIYNYDLAVDPTSASSTPSTYLGYIGATGPWGTAKVGRLESTYLNDVELPLTPFWWMYPTVVANWEQSDAISYVSPTMSGFHVSVEGFDLGKGGKSTSKSTNNYMLSGVYTTGPWSVAAGLETFSKYGDGATEYSASNYQTVWATPVNEYAGLLIKNKAGISGTYAKGPVTVSLGIFDFKPTPYLGTTAQNDNDIYNYLVTGTYAFTPKWTVMGNLSSTDQGSKTGLSKVQGTITSLSVAYSPVSSVAFYAEYQYANKKAVESGLDSDVIAGATGTKAASQLVIGGTYSF